VASISAAGDVCVLRTCWPRSSLQSSKRKGVVSVATVYTPGRRRKKKARSAMSAMHVARGAAVALVLWANDRT
jgi:hypothetical protein